MFEKLILMAYKGLDNISVDDPTDFLTYPLTGDFYFWGKILFGIWIVLGLSTFFEELNRLGKANILSSFAISSLVVIVLAFVGSLFDIITEEILVQTFAIGGLVIFIWFVRSQK